MLTSLCIIFLLGAYHGINPSMGWLFATTLGLQRKSRKVVLLSIIILSLGHAAAIILTLTLVYFLKFYIPLKLFALIVATILFFLGIYLLLRMKHPTWIGMNIGYFGLFLWSFIIASSHGAGLMLSPFLIGHMNAAHHAHHHELMKGVHLTSAHSSLPFFGFIVFIHMVGYMLITGILSVLVYEKFGLRLLKKAWFNFDMIWALTLLITGAFMLMYFQ